MTSLDKQLGLLLRKKSYAEQKKYQFTEFIRSLCKVHILPIINFKVPLSSRTPTSFDMQCDHETDLSFGRSCRIDGNLGYFPRRIREE
jgi:hypothetical protein